MQLLLDRMDLDVGELTGAVALARRRAIALDLGTRDAVMRWILERHALRSRDLRGALPGKAVAHRREARDEAIWMIRQLAELTSTQQRPNSFPQLARYFGLEDHTTVIAAARRYEASVLQEGFHAAA